MEVGLAIYDLKFEVNTNFGSFFNDKIKVLPEKIKDRLPEYNQ